VRKGKDTSPKKGQRNPIPEKEIELILFVADDEPNSLKAKENLVEINRHYFKGKAKIRIVDVMEDFRKALENDVLVTPCLLVVQPPLRSLIIGNLSDPNQLLATIKFKE